MGDAEAYLEVTLDLAEPVEIADFAALFAGFGAEFDRHLKREDPKLPGGARMYVKEVREGSIVARLIADVPDFVGIMGSAITVVSFGALFSQRLRDLVHGKPIDGARKPELKDITSTLQALARDKGGTMTLEAFEYSRGLRGGSVCLNRSRAFSKWISASVMPPPLRASAG